MIKAQPYRQNLLVRFQQTMRLYFFALVFATLSVVLSLVVSFRFYQNQTAQTYIFHPKGASIQIFEHKL